MNQEYVDTVRLLLRAAPEIFSNEIFAMKGGTALNRARYASCHQRRKQLN